MPRRRGQLSLEVRHLGVFGGTAGVSWVSMGTKGGSIPLLEFGHLTPGHLGDETFRSPGDDPRNPQGFQAAHRDGGASQGGSL